MRQIEDDGRSALKVNLDMGRYRIRNLQAPRDPSDAANMQYVDSRHLSDRTNDVYVYSDEVDFIAENARGVQICAPSESALSILDESRDYCIDLVDSGRKHASIWLDPIEYPLNSIYGLVFDYALTGAHSIDLKSNGAVLKLALQLPNVPVQVATFSGCHDCNISGITFDMDLTNSNHLQTPIGRAWCVRAGGYNLSFSHCQCINSSDCGMVLSGDGPFWVHDVLIDNVGEHGIYATLGNNLHLNNIYVYNHARYYRGAAIKISECNYSSASNIYSEPLQSGHLPNPWPHPEYSTGARGVYIGVSNYIDVSNVEIVGGGNANDLVNCFQAIRVDGGTHVHASHIRATRAGGPVWQESAHTELSDCTFINPMVENMPLWDKNERLEFINITPTPTTCLMLSHDDIICDEIDISDDGSLSNSAYPVVVTGNNCWLEKIRFLGLPYCAIDASTSVGTQIVNCCSDREFILEDPIKRGAGTVISNFRYLSS